MTPFADQLARSPPEAAQAQREFRDLGAQDVGWRQDSAPTNEVGAQQLCASSQQGRAYLLRGSLPRPPVVSC